MSKKTTYMLMNIQSGNAINGWIDREEALAGVDRIRQDEPYAMEYIALLEFNGEGDLVDILFDGPKEKEEAEEKERRLAELSQSPQESPTDPPATDPATSE